MNKMVFGKNAFVYLAISLLVIMFVGGYFASSSQKDLLSLGPLGEATTGQIQLSCGDFDIGWVNIPKQEEKYSHFYKDEYDQGELFALPEWLAIEYAQQECLDKILGQARDSRGNALKYYSCSQAVNVCLANGGAGCEYFRNLIDIGREPHIAYDCSSSVVQGGVQVDCTCILEESRLRAEWGCSGCDLPAQTGI
ncbi:MAG: hypothetical protein AABW71_00790 [Nanoarchaeota archaeon]